MTAIEHIPTQLKCGVIVPIPKGDKDRSLQDNYRGITLLPILSRLYEKVLLGKIKKWVHNNQLIDDLQGAGQEACSSLHTNWLVREGISHYREQQSSVYIALMDIAKAFDSIWHEGLFYKLYELGMDGKIWRLLLRSYDHFKCKVAIGGAYSDEFVTEQGLHQGGPFSMMAFTLYNNGLLQELRACNAGIAIIHI
jgi:hypothetical protein